MNRQAVLAAAVLISATLSARSEDSGQASYRPPSGFVPDERTAIGVAEAILVPIYGKDTVQGERPFRAVLRGETWFVEGSLPEGAVGGVAEVEINKSDGRIIRVIHGK